MAKSKGNFIRLVDALDRYGPEVLRMWMASTHYRKPIDYNERDIEEAARKVGKISDALDRIREVTKKPNGGSHILTNRLFKIRDKFIRAMEDDFNTPLALSFLLEAVSLANKTIDSGRYSTIELKSAEKLILEMSAFFQIIPKKKKKEDMPAEAKRLLEAREKARKMKDFAESDRIRDRLRSEFGVAVEDTPKGQKWKRI
jgi:cysteinyl-tRNA synthetase